jgi:hypothetical protein
VGLAVGLQVQFVEEGATVGTGFEEADAAGLAISHK